jgi:abequosyltransferase
MDSICLVTGPRTLAETRPLLSICIPTYNFGRFIGETLQSMLGQMQAGVEIVVLDSASTDNTPEVVGRLLADHECLRYVRVHAKGGIDRDMAEVVRLARGDYCWLFSADDLMCPGALAAVLAEINERHDVYLCMHSNDSLTLAPIDARHPVLAITEDTTFDLSDDLQLKAYFSLALTTEAFFSFMGGVIVRRSTWNRVALKEAFVGTCWAHVGRLFELISGGLTVRALDRVLLRRRAENDSFGGRGIVRRYALAIDGYQALAAHFWGEHSEQAFHVRRVLRAEFGLAALLVAKQACAMNPTVEDRGLLNRLVRDLYRDSSLSNALTRLAYRALPVAIIPGALWARRRLRRGGV